MEKWMVITAMTALISLVWGNAAAVDDAIAHGALEVIASVMVSRHTQFFCLPWAAPRALYDARAGVL